MCMAKAVHLAYPQLSWRSFLLSICDSMQFLGASKHRYLTKKCTFARGWHFPWLYTGVEQNDITEFHLNSLFSRFHSIHLCCHYYYIDIICYEHYVHRWPAEDNSSFLPDHVSRGNLHARTTMFQLDAPLLSIWMVGLPHPRAFTQICFPSFMVWHICIETKWIALMFPHAFGEPRCFPLGGGWECMEVLRRNVTVGFQTIQGLHSWILVPGKGPSRNRRRWRP